MAETVIDDVRSLDPVAYIRQLGLQPEDSYGFVPMSLDEGASLLYLYRDRPEYEQARPKIAMPAELGDLGTGPSGPVETAQMVHPGGAQTSAAEGMFGGLVEQAQQLQQAYGGAPPGQAPAPGTQVSTPDPEQLVKLAKLLETGAITPEEYQRLVAEATGQAPPGGGPAPVAPEPEAPAGKGSIVADRIYPGIRSRSSTRQLNHFLPRYRDAVGIHPEDVYGVFPWLTRTAQHTDTSSTEWDDYWIVYRDRPEYEAGRAGWAKEMDKKGRWPETQVYPGVSEAPSLGQEKADVEVEKDRWPRKALVVKQKYGELADSLHQKIEGWEYEPEDSFGFCPDFDHSAIYFAWRKR